MVVVFRSVFDGFFYQTGFELLGVTGAQFAEFVGFTENLKGVGVRLEQARKAYDDAYGQLTTGAGNLVGQTEKLSKLGARHAKQLEAGLV